MPPAIRETVEHLTCELGAIRELCRISKICPALKKYAQELRSRERTLESELNMRRQSRHNVKTNAP